MRQGSLTIAGTGFLAAAHTTPETLRPLREAEILFYLVGDPVTAEWLEEQNPAAESLSDAYAIGRPRVETYREITERILAAVRQGRRVCAAFYGHPGIFVKPSHDALRQARREGWPARMLPGISAEDCLFADLEIDPLAHGCQSFEATHFVDWRLRFDPEVSLILWQAGAIGVYTTLDGDQWSPEGVRRLTERLLRRYPASHPVVAYEAPLFSTGRVRRETLPLERLPDAEVHLATTLYIPALQEAWDGREPPARGASAARGRLAVVGTGHGPDQLTPEGRVCLERAHSVVASGDLLADPARQLLDALDSGGIVCAVFSGHPCIDNLPMAELLGRIRAAGHSARVYPGISWEDCLFADLGIDPGATGRILLRAEDFPRRSRSLESSALLVLRRGEGAPEDLAGALRAFSPDRETVTVYAPPSPTAPEGAAWSVPLEDLARGPLTDGGVAFCLSPGG